LTDRSTPRWRHRPGWRVAAASAPALLLALVSLWELAAVSRTRARAPGAEDWRALSAALRARHRPGDLIAFAPAWIDPLGRRYLGDLVSLDMAGRMDAARYSTIWEVASGRARSPDTRGLEPSESAEFGPLVLRRYQQSAAQVATDFAGSLAQARVSGRSRARPELSLEEVGFTPRRCVLVEPRPDQTVRITYEGVALGRELVGGVGLADVFTRRDVREPARLVVSIDGRAVADVTVGVDDGWVRFAAPTAGGTAAVEFAVTAVGPRARERKVCFAAEARR
jgi:hypothetical protein